MRRRRSSNVSLTGGLVNLGRPLSAEPSPPHYTDDALLVSELGLHMCFANANGPLNRGDGEETQRETSNVDTEGLDLILTGVDNGW